MIGCNVMYITLHYPLPFLFLSFFLTYVRKTTGQIREKRGGRKGSKIYLPYGIFFDNGLFVCYVCMYIT